MQAFYHTDNRLCHSCYALVITLLPRIVLENAITSIAKMQRTETETAVLARSSTCPEKEIAGASMLVNVIVKWYMIIATRLPFVLLYINVIITL
jgi:hypothetical protein